MDKTVIYHACRVAYCLGKSKTSWIWVLHALREGLGMKTFMTYKLKPKDFKKYPELKELMDFLKSLD